MTNQKSTSEPASDNQNNRHFVEDTSGAPLYFAVTPLKLVIMSICTIGIYELYWFYKNWVLIKEREKIDIMPFWRAFFAYFFCYSFFMKVQTSAVELSLDKPLSPELLASGWIIVTLLWKLPDPFWLVTYFAVIFLLPIQAEQQRGHTTKGSGLTFDTIIMASYSFVRLISIRGYKNGETFKN